MSQEQEFSQEEKQMELEDDDIDIDIDGDTGDLVKPQEVAFGVDDLENDLKFLLGEGVNFDLLQQLQKLKCTTFEEILLLKSNTMKYNIDQLHELQELIIKYHYKENLLITPCLSFQEEIKYFTTGLPTLDKLISNHGGIPSKSITSLIGVASSGKTILLLQIMAIHILKNRNKEKVIFIDCQNQFDGQRFYDLLNNIGNYLQLFPMNDDKEEIIKNAMQRVQLYSVCSFIELMDLLNNGLNNKILKDVDMICLDNIGLMTYLYELKTTFYCHGEICKMAKRLKCLAIKYNLGIITTLLSISNTFESEYWIQSSRSEIYQNFYNFIDNEIHLLLTTRYGAIRPILSKSHSKITFSNERNIALEITNFIKEQVDVQSSASF